MRVAPQPMYRPVQRVPVHPAVFVQVGAAEVQSKLAAQLISGNRIIQRTVPLHEQPHARVIVRTDDGYDKERGVTKRVSRDNERWVVQLDEYEREIRFKPEELDFARTRKRSPEPRRGSSSPSPEPKKRKASAREETEVADPIVWDIVSLTLSGTTIDKWDEAGKNYILRPRDEQYPHLTFLNPDADGTVRDFHFTDAIYDSGSNEVRVTRRGFVWDGNHKELKAQGEPSVQALAVTGDLGYSVRFALTGGRTNNVVNKSKAAVPIPSLSELKQELNC